jgi:hypothetical protein
MLFTRAQLKSLFYPPHGHGLAASLWHHQTLPAVEGGAATVRPALGSRIRHDGYRLMVRAGMARVRLNTRIQVLLLRANDLLFSANDLRLRAEARLTLNCGRR